MNLRNWILSALAALLFAGLIFTSSESFFHQSKVEFQQKNGVSVSASQAAKVLGLAVDSIENFPKLNRPGSHSETDVTSNDTSASKATSLSNHELPPSAGEIQSAIEMETTALQKCLVQEWRRSGRTSQVGTSRFAFEIGNDGKISAVKVLTESLKPQDMKLHQCWAQVLARVQLRPFSGEKVVVGDFPIEIH